MTVIKAYVFIELALPSSNKKIKLWLVILNSENLVSMKKYQIN